MLKTKRAKIIFLVVDLVLLALLAAAVYFAQRERAEVADTRDNVDEYYSRFIEYKGEVYPVKRGLQSVLLIGTDEREGKEPSEIETFYNDSLADFLLLLVFDHQQKTVAPVQINRDTICDVPWLSVNGLVGGYYPMQITLAHSFGSGKQDSSRNTVNAVTGLLYGAPVDHYFRFAMGAVPILNDLVGGVTVTLEDDIPTLGEKYVRGATVNLQGQEALRFVRARLYEPVDANVARMAHQRLYMNAFLNTAKARLNNDPEFVVKAYEKVEPYVITDLTVENLSQMVQDFYDYEVLPTVVPTGTYTLSEQEWAALYLDEDALWNSVHSIFCPG